MIFIHEKIEWERVVEFLCEKIISINSKSYTYHEDCSVDAIKFQSN